MRPALPLLAALLALPALAAEVETALEAAALGNCPEAQAALSTRFSAPLPDAADLGTAQTLALCLASGDGIFAARDLLAQVSARVEAAHGLQSYEMFRQRLVWAEAESRAGQLEIAWQRQAAALTAYAVVPSADPIEYAQEVLHLGTIQAARGAGDAFLAWLPQDLERMRSARWVAEDDHDFLSELLEAPPPPGDRAALSAWLSERLSEYNRVETFHALLQGN